MNDLSTLQDDQTLNAADANRIFYAELAESYDSSTHCYDDPLGRDLLDEILEKALNIVGQSPKVLDACGGTGNVSELLARRGITTTITDISPEMLAVWRHRAADLGIATNCVESEIAAYLRENDSHWDLIAFSPRFITLTTTCSSLISHAADCHPAGCLSQHSSRRPKTV